MRTTQQMSITLPHKMAVVVKSKVTHLVRNHSGDLLGSVFGEKSVEKHELAG